MFDRIRRMAPHEHTRVAGILALTAALCACESGGGSALAPITFAPNDSRLARPAPAAVAPTSPLPTGAPLTGAGVWSGTLSRAGTMVRASCFVSAHGELACAFYRTDDTGDTIVLAAHGTLGVSPEGDLEGSGRLYAATGTTLADGASVVAPFSIYGGYLSDSNRALDFTINALGEVSTLSARFDWHFYQVSSLRVVELVYDRFELFDEPASLEIRADGALFSQSGAGCVGSGRVAILEPTRNIYDVEMTVANCPGRNGAYQGLASKIAWDWEGADTVKLLVFSETTFAVADAFKF